MKYILLILITSLVTSYAGDPVIVVHSVNKVTVDNVDYGKIADTITNNPTLASGVQAATEKWAAAIENERAAAVTALAEKNARITAVLTSLLNEELKTGRGPKVELLELLISEASKTEDQLRKEALQAEIAAKQAELTKLDK